MIQWRVVDRGLVLSGMTKRIISSVVFAECGHFCLPVARHIPVRKCCTCTGQEPRSMCWVCLRDVPNINGYFGL